MTDTTPPVIDAQLSDAITEHLTRAQRHWRTAFDTASDTDDRRLHLSHHIYETSLAWLLAAFTAADPDAAAAAQRDLADMLADPGATGEWVWEELTRRGVDVKTIEAFSAPTQPAVGDEPLIPPMRLDELERICAESRADQL